jgi:hypothetical protein
MQLVLQCLTYESLILKIISIVLQSMSIWHEYKTFILYYSGMLFGESYKGGFEH